MPKKPLEAIEEHFGKIIDPGKDRTRDHKLIDIIAIAMCMVICGAEGWTDIELFGKSKQHWLTTFLELPNGIPSHDMFGRVFSLIDAQQFQLAFHTAPGYGAGVNGFGQSMTLFKDKLSTSTVNVYAAQMITNLANERFTW